VSLALAALDVPADMRLTAAMAGVQVSPNVSAGVRHFRGWWWTCMRTHVHAHRDREREIDTHTHTHGNDMGQSV
jgi:hypothetical protein